MYRQETRSSLVRIVLTILALFMLLSLASVHATEIANAVEVMAVRTGGLTNDAGQGSTGGSTSGVIQEITHNMANAPKGYRFYAIDSDGTQVGSRVDLWYGQGTIDKVRALTTSSSAFDKHSCYDTETRAVEGSFISRWGVPLETLLNENGDNEIPEPFMGQSPNGIALKAWMNTIADGQELANGLRLIKYLFGSDAYKTYIEDNTGNKRLYIIIETLTLFDIVNDRREVVGVFAGSAYNWARLSKNDLKMEYGHPQLRRFSNGVLPLSLVLTEDEEGTIWEITNQLDHMKLPDRTSAGGDANTASNWISNSLMLEYGYGVHAYTFGELFIHTTHTWDKEGCGNTPGPAPKEPEEKKDKVNILKIYYTEDPKTGELLEWQGSYLRNDTPRNIDIEDEDEYKVREWKTTNVQIAGADGPVPHKWEWVDPWTPIQGPSGGPGTVNMNPDKPDYEYTLVVLLTKTEEEELESELIIEESEISIYRKLSEVSDFNLSDTKIKWLTVGITNQYCDYQEYKGSHDCGDPECTNCPHADYDDCGETTVVTVNTNLRFKVKNEYLSSFAHILATKGSFKPEVDPKEGRTDTKSGIGPQAKEKEFDYKFVAYRGKNDSGVKDNLTLANYKIAKEKLSFSNSPVQSLDKSTGNKPVGKRWAQDEQASIEEEVTLKIKLVEDEAGADYKWSGRLKCGHKSEIWKRFQTAENILAEAPVTIHSYSGRPKTASTISGIPQSKVKDCYKGNGYVIPNDDLTISFYPYIRMTYETIGSNDKHDANVLSQHKRTLTVSDYAEAGYMNGGQTLVLRSQQWSIHQMAVTPTDERPWAQQNTVLPGGAIYNVSNKAGAGNTIILRTFQYISDYDSSLLTVMNAAGSKGLANHTRSKAEAEHQKFVASGLAAINNGYYIEQVINDDPMATFESLDGTGWNPVNSGDPGLSTEKKYYLYTVTPAGNKVQSSLIQATASGAKPTEYTVWSDTEGTIYLNGKAILSKGQSVKELKDTEAKYIDTRTKLITNYVGAIERNTGDDFTASWATDDGKWYNEAFSLTVLELETKITVGLQDTKKRETVLDPKLCPKNMGKSDYFSKAISSAYRLNPTSIKAEELGKGSGYVGTFREQDINIANISGLLRSNVFRIPNVNVQDLKD